MSTDEKQKIQEAPRCPQCNSPEPGCGCGWQPESVDYWRDLEIARLQKEQKGAHKAPDFLAFAREICELFFEDGGSPVEYDEFLEAGVRTGVVVERPFNPDDPGDQALADEWGELDVVYAKNFK